MKVGRVGLVFLSAALLLVACAPAPPPPTTAPPSPIAPTPSASTSTTSGPVQATLIVRQEFADDGFYTEGAYAYVELFSADGGFVQRWETMDYNLDGELVRVPITPGRYDLRTYVRPCEAACPALDSPLAACNAIIDVEAGKTVMIHIDRRLRTCDATRV